MTHTYEVVLSQLDGPQYSIIEYTDNADAREVARFYYQTEAAAYRDSLVLVESLRESQ